MTNFIILKNLEICRNTILYLLASQIPGNENIINFKIKISKGVSPVTSCFNQIEEPNLIIRDQKLVRLELIQGADKFVFGYISKLTDIYIMNNYSKFIAKNSQIPSIFRTILNNFYSLSGSEMLHYLITDNQEFIE